MKRDPRPPPERDTSVAGGSSRIVVGESSGWSRLVATLTTSLWLIAVTALYIWTAVRTVRNPPNPGDDIRWAITAIVFLGTSALSFALFPRRHVARVWLAGFVVLGVVILLLSRQLFGALVVTWLLALGWFFGDRLLRWLGATRSSPGLEWTVISLSLGLALLAMVGFGLGAAQLLSPNRVRACLLVLTFVAGLGLRKRFRKMRLRVSAVRFFSNRPTIETGFLLSLLGFVGLLDLVWAVAPEIHYDALNYHLAVPKLYLANGGFEDLPYFWHSYLTQSIETLFALSLALDGQAAARLLIMAIGVIATLGVYVLGRKIGDPRVGLWAAALFYSTPLVSWLSTTAYVDLAAAMLVLALILAFLRWRERRQTGWLWACGLLMGAAIGAKPTVVLGFPVIVLAVLWGVFRRRLSSPSAWKQIAGFLLAAATTSLPWYALRYSYTKNPIFPFLSGILGGSRSVPAAFTLDTIWAGFGIGTSGWSVLQLPVRFTLETPLFGEALPAGAAGLGLLLVLPLGFFLLRRRRRSSVSLLLAIFAVYFLLWAALYQYARFLVPIMPLVAALGAAAVADLSPPGRHTNWILLTAAVVAQVIIIPSQFWSISERIPVGIALGVETRDEFLNRSLREYPAACHLNRVVRPGEKILGVSTDEARFYLNAPLGSPTETWELVPILSDPVPARVADDLARKGYAYLMVDTLDPMSKLPFSFLSREFLDRHAKAVFQGSGIAVYRLKEVDRRPSGAAHGSR